eukprot:m.454931 g.454931  ORF g.454931 m.454931 type:complete len:309 (+) comp20776_c0_seq1:8-934(+)
MTQKCGNLLSNLGGARTVTVCKDMASQLLQGLSFQGRGCVVTGGSNGIGRAIVVELLKLGASVVTCGRSRADLDELARSVGMVSAKTLKVVTADATVAEEREQLMYEASSFFDAGGVGMSLLVNNVGTGVWKGTTETTLEEWDQVIATNLQSAFHLSQLAHSRLARGAEERGGKCSSVINISSVSGGPTCTQSGPAYAATKAALSHFTKYTACEWAPQKIRVNAVSPWYIHTRRTEAILSDANFWAAVQSRTPMRKVGEPTDVANAVAFLASDAASFISGSVLHVDGGFASSGFGFFDDYCIPTPTTP